jgi:hypothetical protein
MYLALGHQLKSPVGLSLGDHGDRLYVGETWAQPARARLRLGRQSVGMGGRVPEDRSVKLNAIEQPVIEFDEISLVAARHPDLNRLSYSGRRSRSALNTRYLTLARSPGFSASYRSSKSSGNRTEIYGLPVPVGLRITNTFNMPFAAAFSPKTVLEAGGQVSKG